MVSSYAVGSMSPDAVSSYLGALLFADSGHIYLEDALTRLQLDTPSAYWFYSPLGDRAVPMHPPGFIFLLGSAHRIFGDVTPYALAVLPAALFIGLARLIRMMRPNAPSYVVLALLGITPLWYWASQTHMNILIFYLFLVLGVTAFLMACRSSSLGMLFRASSLFGLAALVRYPEAPWLLLLALAFIVMFLRQTRPQAERIVKAVATYALAQVLFFLMPMLILNWDTYGSALTFGYSIAFTDLAPAGQTNAIAITSLFKFALFPTPIDLSVMISNLVYRVLFMMPLVVTLGLAGIYWARKPLQQAFGWYGLLLLLMAGLYVLVSRANPESWAASGRDINLDVSIVRYLMPLYIVLGLGAVYALSRIGKPLALPITIAIVIAATHQVWIQDPKSMQSLRADTSIYSAFEEALLESTETNALVIAGSKTDKWSVPVRRTITWRSDIPWRPMTPGDIAISAVAAYRSGIPVYFITGPDDDRDALLEHLSTRRFGLERINTPHPRFFLEKVKPET